MGARACLAPAVGVVIATVVTTLCVRAATITPGRCPRPGLVAARFKLADPMQGQLLRPFGLSRHPILQGTRLHAAETWNSDGSSGAIRSAEGGRVVRVERSGAQWQIEVVHGGGNRSLYRFRGSPEAAIGQCVVRGEPIALARAEGGGVMVSFMLKAGRSYVDPARWRSRDGRTARPNG